MKYESELYHHGIKGQKWGVRRYRNEDGSLTNAGKNRYRSTSIRGAIARRRNQKVDKGFKTWKENAKNRDDAIELGKKANQSKWAYESDKKNKQLKSQYKSDKRAYKKALHKNTTYHRGVVKQEVGRDESRHYLSEAKRIKKQLDADPGNKQLQKSYNDLMTKHDVAREKSRTVANKYAKASASNAAMKRKMTLAVKGAAVSAAVVGGTYYLSKHPEVLEKVPGVSSDELRRYGGIARRVMYGAMAL